MGEQYPKQKKKDMRRIASESQIAPLSRIKYKKRGKFDQIPGKGVSGTLDRPPHIPAWWDRPPTQAGCSSNRAQQRCSAIESYTSTKANNYNFRRNLPNCGKELNPIATNFANKSSTSKLEQKALIHRQGDLLAEYTFRSQLRY